MINKQYLSISECANWEMGPENITNFMSKTFVMKTEALKFYELSKLLVE